jgi:putative MATE family efflux protein
MRNTSIGKLLISMSLPAIFSMLVQSLYNIVDSLFLTNYVGNEAFSAVSVVFPITMFVTAVAIGIGVGANAYIARKLGEGNQQNANKAAKSALIMGFVAWVVIFIVGLTLSKPFVKLFVEDGNTVIIEYGTMYLTIYLCCSIGIILDIVGARILQATGNMKVPMISQLVGAFTNIALDALFIIVFKMGVFGAILATVIGQWAAGAINILAFVFKKQDVSLSFKGFKMEGHYFKKILRVGTPAFIMNAMGSIITIILNLILNKYDFNMGKNVLSAYFKVQSFIFMPVFGLMQGTMPILSYNYGANMKLRFNQTFKKALTIALCVMCVGLALFQLMPETLMSIFESQIPAEGQTMEELMAQNALFVQSGAYAFRVISIAFIPAAFSILVINMLQSINSPISSLLMSLCRQLVFLIPSAFLFDYLWQTNGIWFCYPFAEICALLVFAPFALKAYRKQFAYKQAQYDNNLVGVSAQDATTQVVDDASNDTTIEVALDTTSVTE